VLKNTLHASQEFLLTSLKRQEQFKTQTSKHLRHGKVWMLNLTRQAGVPPDFFKTAGTIPADREINISSKKDILIF